MRTGSLHFSQTNSDVGESFGVGGGVEGREVDGVEVVPLFVDPADSPAHHLLEGRRVLLLVVGRQDFAGDGGLSYLHG